MSCAYASRRGAITALEDVSFSAQGDEFICLVGPSGCGKSTLLRAIAGLVEPTAGQIYHAGPAGSAQGRSGLVIQENGTFPWMTVVENVAFGLEMQGVHRDEREARAMAYLQRVGLAAFARHYPHELSVGMRQRVGIGRAFVSDPDLLLMDEPFGALDAQTRWVLQGELLRLWAATRKLVLFVTHDINEAVLLGDRILVMTGRPGRIKEEVRVPLARPRHPRKDQQTVNDVAWHIWRLLEEEVRSGLSVR